MSAECILRLREVGPGPSLHGKEVAGPPIKPGINVVLPNFGVIL